MNKKQLSKLLIPTLSILVLISGCSKTTTSANLSTQSEDNNQVRTYSVQNDGSSEDILIKEINSAQKNLDIASYLITKENISNAILDAKKKGIDVRVITDSENSKSKTQKEILDKFKQNGISIKTNTPTGLTHLNFIVIDNAEALGGSYNYLDLDDVTIKNDESSIIMKKPDVVSKYSEAFNSMWNNTKDYENYR